MRFRIAHTFMDGSLCKYKGAYLYIEEDTYTIKFGFKVLNQFNVINTKVTRIPNYLFVFRGISISDGSKTFNLYFTDNVADKVYSFFKI